MTYIKTVSEALDFIGRSFAHMESKLDQTIPSVQKLESYPKMPGLFSYALQYVNNSGEYETSTYYRSHDCNTVEAVQKRKESLLKVCDNYLLSMKDIREKNLLVVENNKKVREKITQIMTVCGVPASYVTTDPKSRARIPKRITKPAGYIEDMTRNIPIVDTAYNNLVSLIEKKKKDIESWANKATASIYEEEKARKQKEEENKNTKIVATLRVKYQTDLDAEPDEIMDILLETNKYLNLADAMLAARNDFSEWRRVQSTISLFSVENEYDQEVVDEIYQLLSDWDGDGRIFRDCEHNYSELFSKVPEDLMRDYNLLYEILDR